MMYILNYGIGIGLGLGTLRWPHLGVCVCGAILGALAGELTWIFLTALGVGANAYGQLFTVGLGILIVEILFNCMVEWAVIITSALFGGYAFIRVSKVFSSNFFITGNNNVFKRWQFVSK